MGKWAVPIAAWGLGILQSSGESLHAPVSCGWRNVWPPAVGGGQGCCLGLTTLLNSIKENSL